jgi:hypothetical protein
MRRLDGDQSLAVAEAPREGVDPFAELRIGDRRPARKHQRRALAEPRKLGGELHAPRRQRGRLD